MLKTEIVPHFTPLTAYHLGEGRVLKTDPLTAQTHTLAYHLGEGRVLKTKTAFRSRTN